MFPGGIADKLGNRFEAKWTVRKLIELLLGEAESLRFESIHPNDKGVEFSLTRRDGQEWHQSKRQTTDGNWTIGRLEKEGVLASALAKLADDPQFRFVFVSEVPAKGLQDLTGKARTTQNHGEFRDGLSKDQTGDLLALERVWKTTPEQTWRYLQRLWCEVVSESTLDTDLRLFGRMVFDAPAPTAIFPLLRDYLEKNFNRELCPDILRQELVADGQFVLRAPLDPTLTERLTQATQRYLDSYGPFGVGGTSIPRHETQVVVDYLVQENGPSVLLLTGAAGAGKSGVVRAVIAQLADRQIPHLALRVDRHLDIRSPDELGQILISQSESPVVTLRLLGSRRRTVLIIDQIDAVSEASGRVGSMRDVVFDLIRMARAAGCVRILAVCRSFDLTNDATLRDMEQHKQVQRVEVELLEWERDIRPLLLSRSFPVASISPRQQALLRLPLNLHLLLDITQTDRAAAGFTSTTDLYDRLLEQKERAVRQRGCSVPLMAALTTLAQAMSEDQLLDAPASVLDTFPNAVDVLVSEHLLVKNGRRIAFFHESLFDYAFARDFVAQRRSLRELLGCDEQFLFRRTQVRQILTAYRQAGSPRYLQELRFVLLDSGVRYHLKDAVARWLGTVDNPTEAELDLILQLDQADARMPMLVSYALYPQSDWFAVLDERGCIEEWLHAAHPERRQNALDLLRNATSRYPAIVTERLRHWWDGDGERAESLLRWFNGLRDVEPTSAILALFRDLLQCQPREFFEESKFFENYTSISWLKRHPAAVGQVFSAWYTLWLEKLPDDHPFSRDHRSEQKVYWLQELAKRSPQALLDAIVPVLAETIRRIQRRTSQGQQDWTWEWIFEEGSFGENAVLMVVRSALAEVAKQAPEQARQYLHQLDPASHRVALYLHLETLAANGAALGQDLLHLLPQENLLETGPNGAEWLAFARAANAALLHLSACQRARVEARMLNWWPELQRACEIAREIRNSPTDSHYLRQDVIRSLNASGYSQWCLLRFLAPLLSSSLLTARLAELERKFLKAAPASPNSLESHEIPPPIAQDRTHYMSDQHWLAAMQTYRDDEDRRHRKMSGLGHTGARGLAPLLEINAKENPARFARLLPRLPTDVANVYPRSIINGIANSNAAHDVLLTVIHYFHDRSGCEFGIEIARFFNNHPELGNDEQAFDLLCRYVEQGDAATNDDDGSDAARVDEEVLTLEKILEKGERLRIQGFYGDRGAAAEALGEVIWHCPARLDQSIAVLERRIAIETLLGIRCCLIRPIYSVLRHDRERAAALLRQLVRHDGRWDLVPLTTARGVDSLAYILRGSPAIGQELLEQLLQSEREEQQLVGALHLFREAFQDADLAARADRLLALGTAYRRLAADVAAHCLPHTGYRSRAEAQLAVFFDDPDPQVRAEAADCFRHLKGEAFKSYRSLARQFIRSKAFADKNFFFLLLLNEANDQTFEEVVQAAERLVALMADQQGPPWHYHDTHYLDDLIRREYAAVATHAEHRRRLLDVIDRLLQLGWSATEQIIQEHERT